MCPSGAICLSADCCFSELALKNTTQRVGLEHSGPHHHLIENLTCYGRHIAELALNNNTHSLTHLHSYIVAVSFIGGGKSRPAATH